MLVPQRNVHLRALRDSAPTAWHGPILSALESRIQRMSTPQPRSAKSSGRDSDVVPSRIPSTSPLHQPWALTAAERQRFRLSAQKSRAAKAAALAGDGPPPVHEINRPRLRPDDLMPQRTDS